MLPVTALPVHVFIELGKNFTYGILVNTRVTAEVAREKAEAGPERRGRCRGGSGERGQSW